MGCTSAQDSHQTKPGEVFVVMGWGQRGQAPKNSCRGNLFAWSRLWARVGKGFPALGKATGGAFYLLEKRGAPKWVGQECQSSIWHWNGWGVSTRCGIYPQQSTFPRREQLRGPPCQRWFLLLRWRGWETGKWSSRAAPARGASLEVSGGMAPVWDGSAPDASQTLGTGIVVVMDLHWKRKRSDVRLFGLKELLRCWMCWKPGELFGNTQQWTPCVAMELCILWEQM